MVDNLKISCPCHFGLESVLSSEIKRLGFENIDTISGRVSFTGGFKEVARANLWLRTAERVQIILGTFTAVNFTDLFDQVSEIPFEDFIGKNDAFPVTGYSLNSQLSSVPSCQSIIKKAVAKRLERKYKISWFEENGPVFKIQFSIMKDVVNIMMDTSGAGLHKRGYRQNSNAAPIKETLAAGIVDLARIRGYSQVYDPFCGSGTMLIEAAMHGMKIAPGIKRMFAFEKWNLAPKSIMSMERNLALEAIDRNCEFFAYGSDIDENAIRLTEQNAKKAGVLSRLKLEQKDIRDFKTYTEKAIIITNPPYGERLLERQEASDIYRTMDKVFELNGKNSFYIISAHDEFESDFGKKADRRRKLYNGMLKCQLYMYFKPAGHNRK